MIIKKITWGYVVQSLDAETREFISQQFIAEDMVDYLDENDNHISPFDDYLPFDMVQP